MRALIKDKAAKQSLGSPKETFSEAKALPREKITGRKVAHSADRHLRRTSGGHPNELLRN
jgi:hypothetical protein